VILVGVPTSRLRRSATRRLPTRLALVPACSALVGYESEEHIGYVISGRMAVRAKDGTEVEVGPGEAFIAAPGHNAWVVGDEPCVALDFVATAGAPTASSVDQ
jgi:mannose-6-phosphate isomerase-like protein (cupin superfamily)